MKRIAPIPCRMDFIVLSKSPPLMKLLTLA
jgi:hypothetical protein